jgi:hypothetical protein
MLLYRQQLFVERMGQHEKQFTAAQNREIMGKASHTLGRLATALRKSGMSRRPKRCCERCRKFASRRYISPYHLALDQLPRLAGVEPALDLLEQTLETKRRMVLWTAVDPELDRPARPSAFRQSCCAS